MLIDLKETYQYIKEETIPSDIISSDLPATQNRMQRPSGVIIWDSYNNPLFPITHPDLRLDTSKFQLPKLSREFKTFYSKLAVNYLPWHYTIELVDNTYYTFVTRPLDQVFPVEYNKVDSIDIQNCIHICILGDSNIDVYTKKIYEIIGTRLIGPIVRLFKSPKVIGENIIFFTGTKFNQAFVDKTMRD